MSKFRHQPDKGFRLRTFARAADITVQGWYGDYTMETNIAVFKGKEIRKTIHKNEWWFSVSDVVEALTDSADPNQYIKKMRQRDRN